MKLPERIRLTAPLAGTTYSRHAAIPVRIDTQPSELPFSARHEQATVTFHKLLLVQAHERLFKADANYTPDISRPATIARVLAPGVPLRRRLQVVR